MTTQTTMTVEARVGMAAEIGAALRARLGTKIHPRIWTGGQTVRLYTGCRSEYLEIAPDGLIERSQTNLSWGHVIDEVMAARS